VQRHQLDALTRFTTDRAPRVNPRPPRDEATTNYICYSLTSQSCKRPRSFIIGSFLELWIFMMSDSICAKASNLV